MKAFIYLEDGTKLEGKSFGSDNTVIGELVFNTGMTGYQEVLTDPSYREQIVIMTYPMIGNYGINKDDNESNEVQVKAFIVREYSVIPSHYESINTIDNFLKENNIPGVYDVDTRMLTKRIRNSGSMKCLITTKELKDYKNLIDSYQLPKDIVSMVSRNLKEYFPGNNYKVGILDLGLKKGIENNLKKMGCSVIIYPYNTTKDEIMDDNIDVLLLSNGPGDPKENLKVIDLAKDMMGTLPLWGICLGHQILALALGGDTYKMKFGHRGSNHPVMNIETGKILISSQNHGYAVKDESLSAGIIKTYTNINDDTLEGFDYPDYNIKAVQFHPEEGPGPIDGHIIFKEWLDSLKEVE
ncbi:glutamine-hydrolyzing carbamoyl-phosphate synthase small subunit [Alkalibaculum sp. M08DMB]|uniref:Carbamoyl phosphate synthase small chain n=1 Tax=Alkalibaculum sporogenes TaxID=2655001 RepID=A0A6A7KC94_9FIRM|nr:glutamine-hydrolyzing carbamoyl-phosphate synthase small subunit [Alkalibaculum sporogenes]MPW26633.1 glutamine-hydrolyzing carbamoyl-phosphate synthase small subunit [Alkalibaculum sporogenes]